MIRWQRLEHRFVKHVPEQLEPGLLYISMEFASAAHSCCCGCGEEVVTPFTPTDWKMTFDGETVSLWPSVGNWNQRCRSHYVIRNGQVLEAGFWSDADVAAERRRDKAAKARKYEIQETAMIPPKPIPTPQVDEHDGWWSRLRRRLSGRQRAK
jgi:hypothetical protein